MAGLCRHLVKLVYRFDGFAALAADQIRPSSAYWHTTRHVHASRLIYCFCHAVESHGGLAGWLVGLRRCRGRRCCHRRRRRNPPARPSNVMPALASGFSQFDIGYE